MLSTTRHTTCMHSLPRTNLQLLLKFITSTYKLVTLTYWSHIDTNFNFQLAKWMTKNKHSSLDKSLLPTNYVPLLVLKQNSWNSVERKVIFFHLSVHSCYNKNKNKKSKNQCCCFSLELYKLVQDKCVNTVLPLLLDSSHEKPPPL